MALGLKIGVIVCAQSTRFTQPSQESSSSSENVTAAVRVELLSPDS
jgi:hypothetical protein